MMARRSYRGYLIDARAIPVRDGGWTPQFSIEEHRGSDILDTPFHSGQVLQDEEAALKAAFQLATHQIDLGFTPREVSNERTFHSGIKQ